jgi:dolichol-phosphate mannosyltransferase
MNLRKNWAVVIPMANEERDFSEFVAALAKTLGEMKSGSVYFVVDLASKDRTLELCIEVCRADERFRLVWAPQSRNVVDAYLCGYREALINGHEFIIEMDAGFSHDPSALPIFLKVLSDGSECAFGSRFVEGGSMVDVPLMRRFLSRGGTILSGLFLGTTMRDMTSGYQGFHSSVVKSFLRYPFLSTAHFWQTELRYLLRKRTYEVVPIQYRSPSPRVSLASIMNSFKVLSYYFRRRLFLRARTL